MYHLKTNVHKEFKDQRDRWSDYKRKVICVWGERESEIEIEKKRYRDIVDYAYE